jgi:DNA polymerase I-like protein with 3'-5' exonuclease and polymerase domains
VAKKSSKIYHEQGPKAKQLEILIPSEFDLVEWAAYLKQHASTTEITFQDRPREEWCQDPNIPQTKQHFEEALHHLSKHRNIICDVEGSGLSFVDPRVFICGHVLAAGGKSFYIPTRHITNEPQLDADYVNRVLANEIYMNRDKETTWHNVAYDYNQLLKDGIDLTFRFKEKSIHDTQLEYWLLDETQKDNETYYFLQPGKPAVASKWSGAFKGHATKAKEAGAVKLQGYSLKVLSPLLFGLPMTKFDDLMEHIGFHRLPIHFGGKYARMDGFATELLHNLCYPRLQAEKIVDAYHHVEMPYARVVANMMRRGFGISERVVLRMRERCQEEIQEIDAEVAKATGGAQINWNSGPQVADLLFNKLGYPVLATTDKGKPKTNAETMEKLAELGYKVPTLLSRRNKLSKTVGTYCDGFLKELDVDGRIHTSLFQTGTTTGRLSSGEPNLQNLTASPIFKDDLNKDMMIALRKEIGDMGINKKFDFTVHFIDSDGEPLGMEDGWEEQCVGVQERWYVRDFFTELDYLNKEDLEYPEDMDPKIVEHLRFVKAHPLYGTLDGRKIDQELCYTVSDYNQMELRVMAHYSSDTAMIESFLAGLDIHKTTAADVFSINIKNVTKGQRRDAKAVNFGLIFGKTSFGFAVDWYSNEPDFWVDVNWGSGRAPAEKYQKKAQGFIDRYFEVRPDVKIWMDKTEVQVKKYGFVRTITGRKRRLPDAFSEIKSVANKAARQAGNTKIQGSSADIMKMAMIKIEYEFEDRGIFAMQLVPVHDEIVTVNHYAIKDEVEEIKKNIMENIIPLRCPMRSDPTTWFRYGSAK